jgi:hypothetical protein
MEKPRRRWVTGAASGVLAFVIGGTVLASSDMSEPWLAGLLILASLALAFGIATEV